MAKDAVYSWRLSSAMKTALEEAAYRRGQSVGALLEGIVHEWLQGFQPDLESTQQSRLRAAARRCFGSIRGGEPDRATSARSAIRARLTKRRAG